MSLITPELKDLVYEDLKATALGKKALSENSSVEERLEAFAKHYQAC